MLSIDSVYLSTSYAAKDSVVDVLEQIVGEVDWSRIELSGGTNHEPELVQLLLELKENHGLDFLVHNYFPPPVDDFVLNVTSPDERNRRRSLEFVRNSIDVANEIGSDLYTIHAGYRAMYVPRDNSHYFNMDEESVITVDEARTYFETSMRELAEYAQSRNVKFGFENLFPASDQPDPLICTVDDIKWGLSVLSEYSNTGFLLDLGHLNVAAHQLGFDFDRALEELEPHFDEDLLGVHVSDNNGRNDQHNPLREDGAILSTLCNYDFTDVPVTLEARDIDVETVQSNLNFLREITI